MNKILENITSITLIIEQINFYVLIKKLHAFMFDYNKM